MSTGSVLSVGAAICLNDIATDLHMDSETAKGFFLGAPYWGVGLTSLFSGGAAERWGYLNRAMSSEAIGPFVANLARRIAGCIAGRVGRASAQPERCRRHHPGGGAARAPAAGRR